MYKGLSFEMRPPGLMSRRVFVFVAPSDREWQIAKHWRGNKMDPSLIVEQEVDVDGRECLEVRGSRAPMYLAN